MPPATSATARHDGIELELERHRRELTGYCYRMLGSGSEAEDAVQETILRAWRKVDGLEARPALRSWLYRIATNVCLDMLQGAQRRARPMDLSSPVTADTKLGPPLVESTWVQPVADAKVLPEEADPAELAALRETVRLAFVAALQHLPPRQRAVLILCEVLRWKASEAAELLGTSVASVNSALQRARATMDELDLDAATAPADGVAGGEQEEELLTKYVDAFERYDVASLVTLLADDVTFQMPPHELWLNRADEVGRWMLGPGIACAQARILVTQANGRPAIAIYKPRPDDPEVLEPFNLAVLELRGDRITSIDNFLFPGLFAEFGLPETLPRA